MSIPLDHLYHYLETFCSDDILIYRWYPNGSKKLEDLKKLSTKAPGNDINGWLVYMTAPIIIFHDQEPLNYNLYSHNDFVKCLHDIVDSKQPMDRSLVFKSEKFFNFLAEQHLRSLVSPQSNFNDYTLLCHSEKNSKELELYENNNFIGVYYWCHALIARDWFRFAEHDRNLRFDCNTVKKDFLIYNRAWLGTREYRLKFVELLLNNNLIPNCNVKFNPLDEHINYRDHQFKNTSLSISRYDFENFIEHNTIDSSASAMFDSAGYNTTGIEVVLETLFDDVRQHLTEKILRPIACGKPFILASTAGSLEYLRNYGFKTFDGLIDESYDTIQDPLERLTAIVNEMKRISSLNQHDKHELWKKLNDIAVYNKSRFFSNDFHDYVVNEYVANLNLGLSKCKESMTGRIWTIATDPDIVGGPIIKNNRYHLGNEWLKKYNN